MPISLASLMPWTKASYSATLFDAAKWICSTYLSLSPFGEVRIMPAPSPDIILEPSKCICQNSESGQGGLILSFCPIYQKICQSLGLDRCARLILDSMSCNLNGPLCHSARCIPIAYDFCQWSRTDDCDRMGLKIGLQLLCCHVHTIAHLLIVGVILLGGGEHFTDIVYRPLDQLCLVLFKTLDHHDNTDLPRGCCNI